MFLITIALYIRVEDGSFFLKTHQSVYNSELVQPSEAIAQLFEQMRVELVQDPRNKEIISFSHTCNLIPE